MSQQKDILWTEEFVLGHDLHRPGGAACKALGKLYENRDFQQPKNKTKRNKWIIHYEQQIVL